MTRPIISQIVLVTLITASCAFLSAIAVASEQWPPDGSFIRITRDGGISPYVSVYYDVTVRGRTLVVSMVKDTTCKVVARERVVLLDGADADRVVRGLRDSGAWSILVPEGALSGRAADTPADPAVPRYEFWGAVGRDMTRFFVNRQALDADPGLVRLQAALRKVVLEFVEPLPLRDVFHPADQTGVMAMTASEPATAVIDGWDRVRLPVNSLDLKVGIHDVVVTGRSGATRNFTVRVVPGENAGIHVLLSEEPSQGPSSVPVQGE